jgi:hypothetical protein
LQGYVISPGAISQSPEAVMDRVRRITKRAVKAPPGHNIHEALATTHLFRFLQTDCNEGGVHIAALVQACDTALATNALLPQLHHLRKGGWFTLRDESERTRTWEFVLRLLTTNLEKLEAHRKAWQALHEAGTPNTDEAERIQNGISCASRFVDGIGMQLFFASGAHSDKDEPELDKAKTQRFWLESEPLLRALAGELHPHTAYHLIQTLHYLLPCAPLEIFLVATQSISSAAAAGFQNDSLAAGEVVKLVQRVLADHREIFQTVEGKEPESLAALLEVLDLFVEAGWPEARQLTHRLEEIYR